MGIQRMNKLYKDQRGIAHVLLGLLVVLVVAVAAGAGYMVYRNQTGANITVDKAIKDKCMTDVKDKKYCTFVAHFAKIGDYKFAATVVAGGETSSFTISAAGGNSQMVINMAGRPAAEFAAYGGVTYMKDQSDNKWIEYGAHAPNKPDIYDLKAEAVKADFKNAAGHLFQYKYWGKVSCGNLKCYKYEEVDPDKASTKAYVLFDAKDYQLRELQTNDGTTAITATVTYQDVNISKPSPVKRTVE